MSRSGDLAIAGLSRSLCASILCAALLGLATAARAQPAGPSDSVVVDWGALDALGAAAARPGTAPVTLTPPPRRVVAVMPPPAERPAATASAPSIEAPPPPPSLGTALAPNSPAPNAAAAPPPVAPPAQRLALASVPRAVGAAPLPPDRVTMVRFTAGSSDITDDAKSVLDAAASALAADPKARLQLVAYASGNSDDPVAARRISLTRAVQMRTYLISRGVPSVRMEVRALGDQNVGSGPADRVDLVIVDR